MKLSYRTIIVLLVILLVMVAAAATVSAAESMSATNASGLGTAIAAVDIQGAEGVSVNGLQGVDGHISYTNYRLVSPWAIDHDIILR